MAAVLFGSLCLRIGDDGWGTGGTRHLATMTGTLHLALAGHGDLLLDSVACRACPDQCSLGVVLLGLALLAIAAGSRRCIEPERRCEARGYDRHVPAAPGRGR